MIKFDVIIICKTCVTYYCANKCESYDVCDMEYQKYCGRLIDNAFSKKILDGALIRKVNDTVFVRCRICGREEEWKID